VAKNGPRQGRSIKAVPNVFSACEANLRYEPERGGESRVLHRNLRSADRRPSCLPPLLRVVRTVPDRNAGSSRPRVAQRGITVPTCPETLAPQRAPSPSLCRIQERKGCEAPCG